MHLSSFARPALSSQLNPIEFIDEQPIKHSDMVKSRPINTDNIFMRTLSFQRLKEVKDRLKK